MLSNCTKFLPFILFTISFFSSFVAGCAQQYRRELNYLDFYLGIRPANDRVEIGVQEHSIDKYVERSNQLACDFSTDCLWANAPSDGLLDTNDFFLFQKTDRKAFPIQVGPGNAHPPPGTQFAFAGNLTKEPQSAVLISAPIACQSSVGIFLFEYWLYNSARLEIILLKVNPIRGHLTVMERPPTDCHFLKPNGLCRVEIRRQQQPFRLAIRAFKLQDPAIGAFAMFTRLRYEAELCGFHDSPPIFGTIPTVRWIRQRRPIRRAADLDCGNEDGLNERFQDCLWADFAQTASDGGTHTAHWGVGENIQLWEQIVRAPSHPNGQFYFQYIDPIADFPLPHLRSVLVPCTKTPSTLNFKFWLSSGVQAQVCTLSTDNVALSCVYLNEADAPGPLTIDVDTADHQPFRFSFNVLRVDRAANGGGAIIVLDELKYTGWLCHESGPTTLTPSIPPLSSLFQLRPLPTAGSVDASLAFPDSLECNFEAGDLCPHWMHSANDLEAEEGDWEEETEEVKSQQQRFRLGIVPRGHLSFPMDGRFRGVHSAVALLDHRAQEEQFAILTSRPISCAQRGRISITYFASPGAQLSICANEQCVSARRRLHRPLAGLNHQMMPPIEMSVALNSVRPFRIRIVAERNRTVSISATDPYEPFVLIKRIATKNGEGFCRLENPIELTCRLLACHFAMDGLCKYKTMFLAVSDVPFVHRTGRGIVAQFAKGMRRAILRSPQFRLHSKGHVEMRLEASLSTFSSRLYICPDEQQKEGRRGLGLLGRRAEMEDDEDENGGIDSLLGRQLGHCELLLGPKIELVQMESLVVQIDPELRHFALVAVHDKFEQFGEAEIVLGRVELIDENGEPVC